MSIKLNSAYNAECEAFMQRMLDEDIQVDLILTDPPYNLNKDFGNDSDCLNFDEFIKVNRRRIELCSSLLKPEGSLIWFGIHDYIGYMQMLMHEAGLHYRRMNIWHYDNGFTRSKKMPAHTYEPFLWYSRSPKKWTYNADDVRVPYKSAERLKNPVYYKGKNGERKVWKPDQRGALRGDIWDFPTLAGSLYKKERTEHPTQKPEALFMELIKAFCPKNEEGELEGLVFDPFHGSGTLGVCCERLNREGNKITWLGTELEPKWNDIALSRLEEFDCGKGIDGND